MFYIHVSRYNTRMEETAQEFHQYGSIDEMLAAYARFLLAGWDKIVPLKHVTVEPEVVVRSGDTQVRVEV